MTECEKCGKPKFGPWTTIASGSIKEMQGMYCMCVEISNGSTCSAGFNILAESEDSEHDGQGGILAPWEAHPFRLTSWLDMLQFSANAFFWAGRSLRSIRADCLLGCAQSFSTGEIRFIVIKDIDEQARQKAVESLVSVESTFRKIGMEITADTVKELIDKLKDAPPPTKQQNFQWLIDKVEAIESLASKELGRKLFLYIPPERAKYWPSMKEQHIFGAKVAEKFPSATFDIWNAGICLATTLSTASVFHLMRVLEIGLTSLGKVFNVSLAHTNWEPAIREIESKIREMHNDPAWKSLPDWKDQREFYSQAASHFAILKDAWRNYTMHARGKYTELEAERIFENVKGLMQKLAERLSE